jgi:hypothetical protein
VHVTLFCDTFSVAGFVTFQAANATPRMNESAANRSERVTSILVLFFAMAQHLD